MVDTTIKSDLCVTCICRPLCINKPVNVLVPDCKLIYKTLNKHANGTEAVCVYFNGLDRTLTLSDGPDNGVGLGLITDNNRRESNRPFYYWFDSDEVYKP